MAFFIPWRKSSPVKTVLPGRAPAVWAGSF